MLFQKPCVAILAVGTALTVLTCALADIQPGQGLYYETLTKTWRAKNCDTNAYGVANTTYGLTPAACKACPINLVANKNASYSTSAAYYTSNSDGTGGFTNLLACVTIPGQHACAGRAVDRERHPATIVLCEPLPSARLLVSHRNSTAGHRCHRTSQDMAM